MCPEPTWMFNVLDASHTEVTLYRQEAHSSTPAPAGRGARGPAHRRGRVRRRPAARYAAPVTDPRTDPSPSPGAQPRGGVTAAHRMAGVLTLLEGLVLVGFVVFYVVEMVSGATDDLARAAVSAVLILIFGVALLALARAWFRADEWPKTPTVLWNALLLPVAWSLREGDRGALALAWEWSPLASIVAAAVAPRAPRDAPDGS